MDWTQIVKTVAPMIGTALGGPLGGLAVEAAANALGLTDKTTEAVKQAISGATPEQMLALKQADQQFQTQMAALGFKNVETLEALSVDDRKDARAMQVATRSKIAPALAGLVTVGYFGILIGMMSKILKIDDSQALLLMLGSLSTTFGAVMAYYFGSSAGSARKDEIAAKGK